MSEPTRETQGASLDQPLALHGGPAMVPAGPPTWPIEDTRVRDQLLEAWQDGSWGRYNGPHTQRLVKQLQELHQVDHVLPCCSGTVAVELALRGLGIKSGDEVILAAYDFPGNFRAVEAVGAVPVLVDIDRQSWCLAVEQVEAAVSSSTRAVIVSHLHGGLANMRLLCELAERHGWKVVEDACQSPGAIVQDRMAGTWGDVGVLSFGGSKLLTAGRGGALVTQNESLCQRAKIYGERGNTAFPLSELQAAVLLPQLAALQQQNVRRRDSVQKLLEYAEPLSVLQPLKADDQPGRASYYKLAFRYDSAGASTHSRDSLLAALSAEGLAVGPGFRGFLRRGKRRCRKVGELVNAAEAAGSTVLLHHPALLGSECEVANIGRALRKVARHFQSTV